MKEYVRITDPAAISQLSFNRPTQVRYEYGGCGISYFGIAIGKRILSTKDGLFYSLASDVSCIEFFDDWWVDTEYKDFETIGNAWDKMEEEE